jgi:tetratricopeptide (TPR) repeat protein
LSISVSKLKEYLRFPQIFLVIMFLLAMFVMDHLAQNPTNPPNLTHRQTEDLLLKAEKVYRERPQEALQLLGQITDPDKLAPNRRGDFHLIQAKSYQVQKKTQQCITEALKAEELMTRSDDSSGLMSCYILKGNAYFDLLALTASVESYIKGMNLALALGRQDAVTAVTLNLGNVYAQQKDWLKAKQYYLEALEQYEKETDPPMMSYVLNNLGVVEEMNGNLENSLKYYNKALKIDKSSKDTLAITSDLCNRSEVLSKMGKFSEAMEGYKQSLGFAERIQNNEYIAQILSKKAECLYRMQGSSDSVESWCLQVIRIFENQTCRDLLVLRRSHRLMAEVLGESSNPRLAIPHFKAWRELDSLIMNKENDKKLLEIQASYDSEHLQRRSDQLAFEKSIIQAQRDRLQATNMTLIISFLLVILAAVMVYFWNKSRRIPERS